MASIDEIREIKNRLDIASIVVEKVSLKKSGRNYAGFCPFHSNTHTEAFFVFPGTKTWYCFGCHEGGDIISFVMKDKSINFVDALKLLADKAGVNLRSFADNGERIRLSIIMSNAKNCFKDQLSTPEGYAAIAYLRDDRGLTEDTIDNWGIGCGWDIDCDVDEVGLILLKGRIIFPINDIHGNAIAFSGRSLNGEPKYINTHNNAIFQKGSTLFGLDKAKDSIKQSGSAVVVEGYLDCIMMHQNGFSNTVAVMCSSISSDQLKVLSKLCDEVVLMFDPDQAGEKAIIGSLNSISEFSKFNENSLTIRVASGLSDDPDAVLRQEGGCEIIQSSLCDAISIGEYIIDTLSKEITTEKSKVDILGRIMSMIKKLNTNPVVTENLLNKTAKVLGISRDLLSDPPERKRETMPTESKELTVIRSLLTYPYTFHTSTRMLREIGLDGIKGEDFILDSFASNCFDVIERSLSQTDLYPKEFLETELPDVERVNLGEKDAIVQIVQMIMYIRQTKLEVEQKMVSQSVLSGGGTDIRSLETCVKELYKLEIANGKIYEALPVILGW